MGLRHLGSGSNRRQFLKTSATTAALAVAVPSIVTVLTKNAMAATTVENIKKAGIVRVGRPRLGRRPQLFLFSWRWVWIWLWLWRPHRSRKCGAAAARFARRDQMGRRHGSLFRGRPRPGYVLCFDGKLPIWTHACSGDAQEDHLRRIREMIHPAGGRRCAERRRCCGHQTKAVRP